MAAFPALAWLSPVAAAINVCSAGVTVVRHASRIIGVDAVVARNKCIAVLQLRHE